MNYTKEEKIKHLEDTLAALSNSRHELRNTKILPIWNNDKHVSRSIEDIEKEINKLNKYIRDRSELNYGRNPYEEANIKADKAEIRTIRARLIDRGFCESKEIDIYGKIIGVWYSKNLGMCVLDPEKSDKPKDQLIKTYNSIFEQIDEKMNKS